MKKSNRIQVEQDRKTLTRRDFLKGGVGGLTMTMVPPVFFNLLKMESAKAAGFSPVLPKYRMLHLHFSGGGGIWRYFGGIFSSNLSSSIESVQAKAHGVYEPLSTPMLTTSMYGTTVLRPGMAGMGEPEGVSAFHNAFYSVLHNSPASTASRLQLLHAATTSPDDATARCLYGMMPAVGLAGLQGIVTSTIGLFASPTGNNVGEWVNNPVLKIIPATRVGNIISAVQFSNVLGTASDSVLAKLAEGMKNLSAKQIRKVSENRFTGSARSVYDELSRSVEPVVPVNELNATLNPAAREVFGLAETASDQAALLNSNNRDSRVAHMVYNLMKGHCAAIAIQEGGYDYHNRAKTQTDARDAGGARLLGRCIELAARLTNSPGSPGLFVVVTQDGGNNGNPNFTTSTNPNTALFVGDRRDVCASLVFVLNPPGETTPLKPFYGSLRANGRVEPNTPMGRDRLYSGMVFYSYLWLNGMTDRADVVLQAAGYTATEISLIKNPANSMFNIG